MPLLTNDPFSYFDHTPGLPTAARPPFNRVPVFSTMGRGPRGEKGEKGDPATPEGEVYTKDEIDAFNLVYDIDSMFGIQVAPFLIGVDYAYNPLPSYTQYSAVCEHDGFYYGFFPFNDENGTTVLRKYNEENKLKIYDGSYVLGHANSCCFIDEDDVIYCVNSTGDSNDIDVFDTNFNHIEHKTLQDGVGFYGISYDSHTNKLYAMVNVDYEHGHIEIREVDKNTLEMLESYQIDTNIFNGGVLQDIAVNDGMAYISAPAGAFFVYDLSDKKIVNYGCIHPIDAYNMRNLGELEGWEFNDKDDLVAAHYLSSQSNAVGFTTKVIVGSNIPRQDDLLIQTRTIQLFEDDLDKWDNSPYKIRCLTELLSLVSPTISSVLVKGEIPISTEWVQPIFKDVNIEIDEDAILNTKPFILSCSNFTLTNKGTINVLTENDYNTSAFNFVYNLARATINNLGIFNHEQLNGNPPNSTTINMVDDKNSLVIGNLSNSKMTLGTSLEDYVIVSENSMYIGNRYKLSFNDAKGNLLTLDKVLAIGGSVVDIMSTGVRVHNTSASAYCSTKTDDFSIGLIDGKTYKIKAYVKVASGKGNIAVRNSSTNSILNSTGAISSDGYYEVQFTYNESTPIYISLFCTFTTSELGDVYYTDLVVEESVI